jgi:very-short-patch-repair endonuclease
VWVASSERCPSRPTPRDDRAKVRVAKVAARQWGRIHLRQLIGCGVSTSTVSRWVGEGYLHEVYPRVYAVGHVSPSVEADLMAAVLYAGPGAMLSHTTAAWWWGLTGHRPRAIEVSTPWKRAPRQVIRVHGRRRLARVRHNGLPVTTVPQTLLDYAATHPLNDVRYVIAEADYHRILNLDDVRRTAGRGRPGSTKLRQAIDSHWPDLARTRSRLERSFLFLCEEGGLPRPKVNAHVHGIRVDAYWPEYRLVVEIDGAKGHSTQRQVRRDHARDLKLRTHGETVRRYSEPQVLNHGAEVLADLCAVTRDRKAA